MLTVYYANTPVPQGPHTSNGPPGWTDFGCWRDGSSKALANGVQVEGGGSNMTVIGCTAACDAAGYKLAGVEYASKITFRTGSSILILVYENADTRSIGECYCDNYVAKSATNVTLNECNMPCNGNSSEFCGAGNRMNIYASGSTTPSVKPSVVAPAPPGGWFDRGCYNDSSAARTLNVTQYLQVPMTIEACTSACIQNNYTLAGVEYGGKLWRAQPCPVSYIIRLTRDR